MIDFHPFTHMKIILLISFSNIIYAHKCFIAHKRISSMQQRTQLSFSQILTSCVFGVRNWLHRWWLLIFWNTPKSHLNQNTKLFARIDALKMSTKHSFCSGRSQLPSPANVYRGFIDARTLPSQIHSQHRRDTSIYRGYPAERALSAMRKHGG